LTRERERPELAGSGDSLLAVDRLSVTFDTDMVTVTPVEDVSFRVGRGEIVALVGESGSGKSVTALTIMGLTRAANARFSGRIVFDTTDLLSASETTLRRYRGARIAMIFQDPMTALDPVYRVGDQVAEQIRTHTAASKRAARLEAVGLLERVGIAHATERSKDYPHEFSGGMRQRVMIAMALACSPELLIADEPTTALDVTIQAQILAILKDLRKTMGMSILFVTHDFGVVAEVADRVLVMYAGQIVEAGTVDDVFYAPQHPYTWGLLGCIPPLSGPRTRRLLAIAGSPPSVIQSASGCRFASRCAYVHSMCTESPDLEARAASAPAHLDRCWLDPAAKRALRPRG
jgi:peptide/nickel transport system ATP-binding protein